MLRSARRSSMAMPRAHPSGSGVPQPDIFATMSSALNQSSRRWKPPTPRCGVRRIPSNQLAPVLVRILAGGMRELINETFHVEDVRLLARSNGDSQSERGSSESER